ncbi:MAG: purine-nucleoside phosphorylase [Bacteroidota bacterium]|nr:purine-nucleoside phosphorylase [Candidatus Kapabacteria bacterium]MDW8220750.1 purine-nucleoside phosphorylase [Bacteroidota bacterium]
MTHPILQSQEHKLEEALHEYYGTMYRQIREHTDITIDGVVISGSGLHQALECYPALQTIDLHRIDEFPQPTVVGHSASLRFLGIEGKQIAHYTGRCHLYEGFTLQQSLTQIALGKLLGARFVILTNSAGGMHHSYVAGDIMLITDVLNLMLRPAHKQWLTSLYCHHCDSTWTFPEYFRLSLGSNCISVSWRQRIAQELARRGVAAHHGAYIGVTGPTFETPAEARMYRKFGEAIGMSTAHEAEFAYICGLHVAACSLITNILPESVSSTVSHNDVVHAASVGAPRVAAFVAAACVTAP